MGQGPGNLDSGVIDQAVERSRVEVRANLPRRSLDRGFIRHIKQERYEHLPKFLLQAIGVFLFTHAPKDAEATLDQHLDTGMTDAGGNARDDRLFHMVGSTRVGRALTSS